MEFWDLGVLSVIGLIVNLGEFNLFEMEVFVNDEYIFNLLFFIFVSMENLFDICKMFMVFESSGGFDEVFMVILVVVSLVSCLGLKRWVFFMYEVNESCSI